MISFADAEEKRKPAIDAIESMMQEGIFVLSDVDIIPLVRSASPEEMSDANR